MSKYTTELRYILQAHSSSSDVNQIIADGRPYVFDFEYPIFDENYKTILETKILKHYYTREICAETVGLWKLWLDEKMNLIMKYYNQLYESEALQINPLVNFSYSKQHSDSGGTVTNDTKSGTTSNVNTGTRENEETNSITNTVNKTYQEDATKTADNSESESETNSSEGKTEGSTSRGNTLQTNNVGVVADSSHKMNKFSDTPQGSLTDVEDGRYLTTATADDTVRNETSTEDKKEVTTEQIGNLENTNVSGSRSKTNSVDIDETFSKTNTERGTDSISESKDNVLTLNTRSDGTVSETNARTFTTTTSYLESISGKNGVSDSKLLKEYRDTFLNIDEMIINDLSELFLQIW